MFKREDIVDFTMNVDPKMKGDTIIEKENNKEFTYDEIKNAFPIHKQDPIRCAVYWDDICQFTSIGLIELVNQICESNAKIDLNHFFNRPNEYSYGIKYVYKLFEKVLTKEQIQDIKKKFYWRILTMSLRSELFMGLIRMDTYFDRLGFFFPCRFENCEILKKDLKNIFFKNDSEEKLFFYYAEDGVVFNSLLKQGYNSIITPNMADTYEYIINNKLERISMISPSMHNGLSDELYDMFCKYSNYPRPNKCQLSLYDEFPVLHSVEDRL